MAKRIENQASSSLMMGNNGREAEFSLEELGIDDDRPSMSSIPTLKLAQALSPEVSDRSLPDIYAGTIFNSVTKEVVGTMRGDVNELEIRVLRIYAVRTKWAERGTSGNAIECSCPTIKDPDGEYGTLHGKCATCSYLSWSSPDHCQDQLHMVVVDANDPTKVYRLMLARTSLAVGKALNKELKAAIKANMDRAQQKYHAQYEFPVLLTAELKKNPRVNAQYYVYKLSLLSKTPVPMSEELAEALKEKFYEVKEMQQAMIDYHKEHYNANTVNADDSAADAADSRLNYTFSDAFKSNAPTSEPTPGSDGEIPF